MVNTQEKLRYYKLTLKTEGKQTVFYKLFRLLILFALAKRNATFKH